MSWKVVLQPPGIFSLILDLIPGLDRCARSSKRLLPTACIENTTSSQGHPKSTFVTKCLSSLHNACKLDGPQPPLWTWKGPSKRCLSSCDCRFLRFLFWSLHIPWFGLWQSVANGALTKMRNYPPSISINGVDKNIHYGTRSCLLLVISWKATTVFQASFGQICSATIFAVIFLTPCGGEAFHCGRFIEALTKTNTFCQTCKTYWVMLQHKQDFCEYSSCKFWNVRSWMSQKYAKVKL